jgi:hypothetical protein
MTMTISSIARLRFRYRVGSRIRRDLVAAGSLVMQPQVRLGNPTPFTYDFTLLRDGGDLIVLPSEARPGTTIGMGRYRMAPYVHFFSLCPEVMGSFICDTSDGNEPGLARYKVSSSDPSSILLPDSYFFKSRGFANAAAASQHANVAWHNRSDTIVWRGTCTGAGKHPQPDTAIDDATVNVRSRLCLALRGVAGTDARISGTDRDNWPSRLFADLGIWADQRPEPQWLGDKFAIDVDGWTNTWSNLIVRLHYGCCVLKVDSQYGFRQWYYLNLRAWEHYVPVKADFSDLLEKIDWVRTNEARSREIAAAGQAFARTMTIESETAFALAAIRASAA